MYCTTTQVREMAAQMTEGVKSANSPTLVTNETLIDYITRASRIFDLTVGVKDGYFESAYFPVWQSNHVYVVGEIVTPVTRNGHQYVVTTAGTSGASQPTFPTGSGATVTNGTVVFTENGADVVASARTFYGDGTSYLKIDPYVPGTLSTTITVPDGYTAQEFIEGDGYLLRSNTGIPAAMPSPRWFSGGWADRVPVTVTALWGFDGTPEEVKAAVIELAINLWRETDPASSKLVNLDGGILREVLPPRVKEAARRWRYRAQSPAFI